ncbi:MAG TPA: pentapeptide repeat-containing protein, partial [Methylococcales bacterium]
DLQLLSSSEGINLPIAGINVPVAGFYIVMPLFVVALHFNFLQNLESHHYKLMCWKKSHLPSQIQRSQIQPFLFDYAELETGGQFDLWVRFVNSFLCLYLAPITLGLLLWRFTDRQEALITIWQFFIFLLDCWLAWKLIHAMKLNKQLLNMSPTPVRSWLDSLRLMKLVGFFLLLETLLTALVTWLPSKEYIIYINSWAVPFTKMNPRIGPLLLPYLSITSNETVWKPDNNYLETMAKLEGEMDLETFFKTQGQGFKPSTPNLRLANLPGQYIPNAQLKWLQLEGAYLESAKLQGANLSEAHLQAVNLKAAELQGANLSQAHLQGAQLQGANLQGVDL